MADIGSVADLIALIIKTAKPSELEKIKAEIRKIEEERIERKKKLLEVLASGDVIAVNALLFDD